MDEVNSSATRRLLPPAYLLGAVLWMTALHLLVPGRQLLPFAWRLAGAIPLAAGLLLNLWANQLFKRAGTSVKPFDPSIALVLEGPFLLTQNPLYFGMVLVLVGVAMGLGSATVWLAVPLFVWLVTRRFIVPEERQLDATFHRRYHEYRTKVRRWV